MVLLRFLEHVASAILFTCAIAVLVAGILLWHGRSAVVVVELLFGLGIVAGAIWGIISRPTLFQAALEIDRQTDAAELFSSALLAVERSDLSSNVWARAVIATAEQHCYAASMGDIRLRRYGGREWGGISLAIALVFTLVLLGPAPVQSRDQDTTIAARSKSKNDDASNPDQAKFISSSDNRPIVLPDPDDLSPNSSGNTQTTIADPAQGKPGDVNPSDAQSSIASSEAGKSGGKATTHSPPNSAKSPLSEHATASAKPPSDNATATAEGAGSSSPSEKSAKDSPNTAMLTAGGSNPPTPPPAPWKSANWPAQIDRAQKAIDGGRVPAAYRDLVRDYFSLQAISTVVPD